MNLTLKYLYIGFVSALLIQMPSRSYGGEAEFRKEVEAMHALVWARDTDPTNHTGIVTAEDRAAMVMYPHTLRTLMRVLDYEHPLLAVALKLPEFNAGSSRTLEPYLRVTSAGADLSWEETKFGKEFEDFRRRLLNLNFSVSREAFKFKVGLNQLSKLIVEMRIVAKYTSSPLMREGLAAGANILDGLNESVSTEEFHVRMYLVQNIFLAVARTLDVQGFDCTVALSSLTPPVMAALSKSLPRLEAPKRSPELEAPKN